MGSEDHDCERMSDIVERLRRGVTIHTYDEGHTLNSTTPLEVEAAEEITRLRVENEKLRAVFRVNMLRAFPSMSHEEIDAEIEAAIRESGDE